MTIGGVLVDNDRGLLGTSDGDVALHAVADAIEISAATVRNIWQNLFGAFIYNSLGIPVAAGILYPFSGMLLNPMIAGAAMALSSVTVVSNANRLRRMKPGGETAGFFSGPYLHPAYGFGQLAAFFVTDVSRRGTDQS